MITITLNTENGAEARKELLDLLGIGVYGIDAPRPEKDFTAITVVGSDEGDVTTTTVVEEPTAEKPKTRRKATAEVKPETIATNTGSEEPPANDEAPATVKKLTLDDAKLAAAQLSRAGFRNEAKEIAYKYAAMSDPGVDKEASLVPKIAPENYEAFIAEIEAVNK